MLPYTQEPEKPSTADYSRQPQNSYNSLGIDVIPLPEDDELRCDNCGTIWKKSQLRRCKKCGAVLCPKCREKHKCGNRQKANSCYTEYVRAVPEREQIKRIVRSQKGRSRRKWSEKLKLKLIVLLIFVVAIAIATVMLVQNGQLTF